MSMEYLSHDAHATLDRIQSDLRRLRKADRTLQVFGASHHRYKSTPVSASSIDEFEQDLGVELPPNYREFLLRIGYGSGPYYGIWSPAEVLKELDLSPDPSPSPAGKFPLESVHAHQFADWPNGGCIPIGHQGCTKWTVLVLEGKFRGTVWDMACFEGVEGEWLPARRPLGLLQSSVGIDLPPLGRPPNFLEWIERWIECCKLDLEV